MSRIADVQIQFNNNLTDQKRQYDEFLGYIAQHPANITGSSSAGGSAGVQTATFGGGLGGTVGAAQQAGANARAANADLVSRVQQQQTPKTGPSWDSPNFIGPLPYYLPGSNVPYRGLAGNQGPNERWPAPAGLSGGSPWSNAPQYAAYSPWAGYSPPPTPPPPSLPALHFGSYGQYSGGPVGPTLAGGNFFSNGQYGTGAAGPPGLAARLLEGHLTPYAGALGIANAAGDYLSGKSQYATSMARATTNADVVGAQLQQANISPFASAVGAIPFFGAPTVAIGTGIRDRGGFTLNGMGGAWRSDGSFLGFATASEIAGTQTATGLNYQNDAAFAGIVGNRQSNATALAGGANNYAGRLQAIELANIAAITGRNMSASLQSTQISSDIKALSADPEDAKKNAAQIGALTTKLGLVQQGTSELNTQGNATTSLARTMERLSQRGANASAYASAAASDLIGVNDREATRQGIRAGYAGVLAGSNDPAEIARGQLGQASALNAEQRMYDRQTNFMRMDLGVGQSNLQSQFLGDQNYSFSARRSSAMAAMDAARAAFNKSQATDPGHTTENYAAWWQSIQSAQSGYDSANLGQRIATRSIQGQTGAMALSLMGNPLAAANAGTNARYDQQAAQSPELAGYINMQRGVELAQNQHNAFLNHYGINADIQDRNRGNQALALQGDFKPMTAQTYTDITDAMRQVTTFNTVNYGPEFANERAANTASQVDRMNQKSANLQRLGNLPGRAEEVSGYTYYGDFGNPGFSDYQSNMGLAATGGQQVQDASNMANGAASQESASEILGQILNAILGFNPIAQAIAGG